RGMFVNQIRVDANGDPVLDANGNQITDRVNLANIPNVIDGDLVRSAGTTVTKGLPSINLRFKPSDSVQVRVAYGITMDQAQFYDLRATGNVGLNVVNNQLDPSNPFKSDTGNPLLKPAISKNSDVSLEWYHGAASTHVSLFHKAISNSLVYSTDVKD